MSLMSSKWSCFIEAHIKNALIGKSKYMSKGKVKMHTSQPHEALMAAAIEALGYGYSPWNRGYYGILPIDPCRP